MNCCRISWSGSPAGEDARRRTPALVFCFDREVCWSTAEVLRGKDLFAEGQRQPLLDRLEAFDFSIGSGNKLRTFLARGIGIHHAGLAAALSAGWSKRCFRRSCCRSASARKRWRRGSICRRGRWC